jgi:hypothetical protein
LNIRIIVEIKNLHQFAINNQQNDNLFQIVSSIKQHTEEKIVATVIKQITILDFLES